MHPLLSLSLLSLGTAVVLLLVVRRTSDQRRIVAVKRQIRAGLFEIRLFNDDPRAILRAQGDLFRHNLTYLRLSAVPLLWVIVPFTLLAGHLQAYYGYDGLRPGAAALITVGLDAADPPPDLSLASSSGLRVETPPVWAPSLREAAWRIAAEAPGRHEVHVLVGGETFSKQVLVSTDPGRRSPYRLQPGLVNWVLYPAEPSLPRDAAVRSIAVTYPERAIPVMGMDLHWMVIYFLLTLGFALLLRGPLGVAI